MTSGAGITPEEIAGIEACLIRGAGIEGKEGNSTADAVVGKKAV
jgi:hypothetical protein